MGWPTEEDTMAFTLAAVTCPLCGLSFANQALLELHLREDHRRRPRPDDQPEGTTR
jgi:hypothetical protein